ncbi:CRISPR-associated protein (Cas_Cmr3) [Marinomonas spartinae]|uniref:type III-B CRISPR module-associated protein Cmr3 n=1 Tax=Marinomonas spartinae TaxID=1792290 RepID=UPI000808B47F|nr:type III-B CRISPR module-associated protein Cmr3 [Marinomonas spartinae]SBS35746.1 CRISPR-associated protein (Cas_Cmr3) [Marinomonas spartinae]
MNYFVLNPLDPLIIRSSRPFEAISDAEAAKFPPPSTIAGALRNLHGRTIGIDFNDSNKKEQIEALLDVPVTGPLAVKIPVDQSADKLEQKHILVPKPADAQYFVVDGKSTLIGLQPEKLNDDEGCDLPNDLRPLFLSQDINGKPVSGPKWWSLTDLLDWRTGKSVDFGMIKNNGWTPTKPDIRTHVERDNKTRNSVDGQIFQTTGLTMWQQPDQPQNFPNERVAILAGIKGVVSLQAMNLGGERRLAEVEACSLCPKRPDNLVQEVIKAGGLILTFLTPTIFANGWRPAWLDEGTPPGCEYLKLKLRAAAVDRWQPQSGWDLASNKPRASERMIPAGATYWFEIVEGTATEQEIEKLWMAHLCDDKQHNLNGFGLTLPMAYSWNESNIK